MNTPDVIISTEAAVIILAALGVFTIGCARHWWDVTVRFGIRSPDQRLTKAEKNSTEPVTAPVPLDVRKAS